MCVCINRFFSKGMCVCVSRCFASMSSHPVKGIVSKEKLVGAQHGNWAPSQKTGSEILHNTWQSVCVCVCWATQLYILLSSWRQRAQGWRVSGEREGWRGGGVEGGLELVAPVCGCGGVGGSGNALCRTSELLAGRRRSSEEPCVTE